MWYIARVTATTHLGAGFINGQQVWVRKDGDAWYIFNGYRACHLSTDQAQVSVKTRRRRDNGAPVVAMHQKRINASFKRRKK